MDTLIAVLCGNNIVTHISKAWDLRPLERSGLRAIFTTNLDCFLSSMLTTSRWLGQRTTSLNGWSLLKKGLVIETPVPIGVYFGCGHEEGTMKVDDIVARTMIHNMEDFLTFCVDRYLELARNGVQLRTVATQFLVEDQGISPQGAPNQPGPFSECPWCKHTSPANTQKLAKDLNWKAAVSVNGSLMPIILPRLNQQREMYTLPINISKHSAITTVKLKFALFRRGLVRNMGTPPPSPDEGRLQPIAAKVLMKIRTVCR